MIPPASNKLFIAIPAPAEISAVLMRLRQINAGIPGVRWVPEENLHLTVFFLGFVDVAHIPDVIEVMNKCLQLNPEFFLQLKGITLEGARPNHPSMVWARFEKNKHFAILAGEIRKGVAPYINSQQLFPDPIPHITLARIKNGPVPDVLISAVCEIEFTGYELWRSVAGAVSYERLTGNGKWQSVKNS